ncbi:MAG: DMT family transporter [Bacteroidales bacterium]|nr:DMT family transporter [Bacteroidales bacterium]
MQYIGEVISIGVAISWALSALFFEYAGKRIGSLIVNILRLFFAFFLLGAMLMVVTGSPWPQNADRDAWLWMVLSGLVGFVFGDLCLFHSYLLITARFSQLLMTLAPPFAALFAWLIMGEELSFMAFLGMCVTLTGIAISVLKRDSASTHVDGNIIGGNGRIKLNLPVKGLLLGIGGALGQGLGIVLSKQGMYYYELSAQGTAVASYIPFAATQIRIITGLIGFSLIIILSGRFKNLLKGFKDAKGMRSTFAGSVFGPFIGVSLSLMAVQYTDAAIASTIMATTPVIILIPYILLYKKKVTPVELLGAILSVGGVALFFI